MQTFLEFAREIEISKDETTFDDFRAEVERYFSHETPVKREMILANYAMNHAVAHMNESINFDPIKCFDYALELATRFQALHAEHAPNELFLMNTDEPALMWSSPWDVETQSPAEYAFVLANFLCQNDEASYSVRFSTDEPSEFDSFTPTIDSKEWRDIVASAKALVDHASKVIEPCYIEDLISEYMSIGQYSDNPRSIFDVTAEFSAQAA